MKVLIVEDERMAARRLSRMCLDILGDREVSVICHESLEEAREFLRENPIDILVLDLNLHGQDGFQLLKEATAGPFQTIVVSANTGEALRAFEFGVLDFVPKPFDRQRLESALRRALSRDRMPRPEGAAAARYLTIRGQGSLSLCAVEEILYLKGADDSVEIYTRNGRPVLHSKSLEALEKLLPDPFQRVHKSYVVDTRTIRRILVHGAGKYELELEPGGIRIPLSRSRYKEFAARFTSQSIEA